MANENSITGIMLTDNEARIAIIDLPAESGGVALHAVARIPLEEGPTLAVRLSRLESELYALGCTKSSTVWVACSLPEMSFATIPVEKLAMDKLAPMAWLKFRKEVESLPDKVVFDFELPNQASDDVVPMWELSAFAAPYEELEAIESWFASRFKLQGITMDMFACRNLLARSEGGDETVALLSCENNISRIMLIKGGCTVFTRTIKAGAGTLIEHVERELERPVSVEKVETLLNMSEEDYVVHIDPDKTKILRACTSGADRLFTQVGRALDYYTSHLKNPRPGKLFLSGNLDLLKRFIPELSSRLMLEVELLDLQQAGLVYPEALRAQAAADGGLEDYSAAIGAALGHMGRTPNLICTHDVKERLLKAVKIRKRVASGFISLAAALAAVLLWQANHVRGNSLEIKKIKGNPLPGLLHITTGHADLKVEEIQQKHQQALLLSERYKLVTAMAEVQALTPEGILIKNLSLKADDKAKTGLVLEGVVMGLNGPAAMHLAKYVVDLNASPMFAQVVIIPETDHGGDSALRRKGALSFRVEGRFVPNLTDNKG